MYLLTEASLNDDCIYTVINGVKYCIEARLNVCNVL